jgi:hypothetical protein
MFAVHALARNQDYIVTINQVSSSGKTMLVDKGSNHGVVLGDFGVMLIKVQDEQRTLYKPVAKLKAVKVFGENSIWVSFERFMPEELQAGARLMLFSEAALLSGRTPLKIDRTKIVSVPKKVKSQVKDSLTEDPENLGKKHKLYHKTGESLDAKKHFTADVTLVDLDEWKSEQEDENVQAHAIFKSPYAREFSDRKRVETFEKMVVAFIRKYNDPKFTLKDLYYAQKKDPHIDLFPNSIVEGSTFSRYLDDQARQKEREEKVTRDLLSKGESWSDGYSDEELSELLYNVGVLQERERRDVIAAHKFNHQFYGHFGLNLINNENLNDRNNTEQSKYDLEIAWEYYVFKSLEGFDQFAFELSLRRAQDAFAVGDGYNATSVEYSGAMHLNWYPFIRPNTLERNIVYFGMVFRTGLARLKISDTLEEGNYQISSLPGARLGVKYNFTNSFGIRLNAGLENIQASRIVRSYDGGLLPDRADFLEGKFSIGLSKFY